MDEATDEDTRPASTPSSAATTTNETLVASISPLAGAPRAPDRGAKISAGSARATVSTTKTEHGQQPRRWCGADVELHAR